MEAQEMASQEKDSLAGDVMESLGEPKEAADEINESHDSAGAANPTENSNDPLYVQKRLKQQRRQHDREIRELHARNAELQSKLGSNLSQDQASNPYMNQVEPGSVEEHIHKAVSFALNHRDMEERKAKEAENAAHVQKQYNELYKHLDSLEDKYHDFHDIVFGNDTEYTPAMRDYSMTLPKTGKGSAGEVLYNLGKNPSELQRIAKLHPIDQASEMARLSHALISGGESKGSQPRPLGQIKSNPVTSSHATTDKTPISNIRQRMKSGTWK